MRTLTLVLLYWFCALAHASNDDARLIDVYGGSGHGFSLNLTRLIETKPTTGIEVHVLRVKFKESGYVKGKPRSPWPDDEFTFKVETAFLAPEAFEHLWQNANDALKKSESQEAPPIHMETPDGKHRVVMVSSSSDMLTGIGLANRGMCSLKHWAGYRGTMPAAIYGPLEESAEHIEQAIEKLEWTEAQTDETRAFVSESFARLAPSFNAQGYWWVRERLIQLAGACANADVVPELYRILKSSVETNKDSASEKRCVGYALTALDTLTGREFRFFKPSKPGKKEKENPPNAERKSRKEEDVAADYLDLFNALYQSKPNRDGL